MEGNTKIVAGATGAGAIATGLVAKHQQNIIKNKLNNVLSYKNVDNYVSSRIEANMDKIHNSLKQSKWKDAFRKIAEKAKNDYPVLIEKAKKAANITNGAIIVSASLAIGTLITLISSKVKANKAEKAQ